MRPSLSSRLWASLSRLRTPSKNCLCKESGTRWNAYARFDAHALDDAARQDVPLLRSAGLICSDELSILGFSSRPEQGRLEAAPE